jgi:hypothetical protein
MKTMTRDVLEKHPDVAKKMEQMHNQEPKQSGSEMRPKWDATADSARQAKGCSNPRQRPGHACA